LGGDIMKLFKLIYNSFIWGLLVAILAFQSEWLEMRMNVGLIIPVVMIISTLGLYIYRNNFDVNMKFSTVNLCASWLLTVIVIGSDRIKTLPASILREAVGMTSIKFGTLNIIISIILIGGLILIGFKDFKKK
jgi:hypothetical protein